VLRTCDVHDAARGSFDDDGCRSRFSERLSRIYEVPVKLGVPVCRHVEMKMDDVSLFDESMHEMMMDGPRPLFILCDRKQKRAKMSRSSPVVASRQPDKIK
jgi:hypothetical protein